MISTNAALFLSLVLLFSISPLLARDLDLSLREEDFSPTVTLREYENRTVEEFSVQGRRYMVKITPIVGAPYYLVDEDGSGDLAWHRDAGTQLEQRVPQWVLFRW